MNKADKTAVFRADGDERIGAGHLSRCLAIADVLMARGWRVDFVLNPGSEAAFRTLAKGREAALLNAHIVDAANEASALRGLCADGCDLFVLDKYDLARAYLSALRPWAAKIAVLEDMPNRDLDCDLLVDGNPSHGQSDYVSRVPERCRLLLGSGYLPLHPIARRDGAGNDGQLRKILVCLGAGVFDAASYEKIAMGIAHSGFVGEVLIVCHASLTLDVADTDNVSFRVEAGFMDREAMTAGVDLAIGGGGVMLWERCVMGIASVVYTCSDNQAAQVDYLAACDAIIAMGLLSEMSPSALTQRIDAIIADPARRRGLVARAGAECDGQGCARIADALESLCHVAG